MADQRRGPRTRNNRRIRDILKIKPFVITFSIIIFLCLGILIYKNYETNLIKSKEQDKRNEELYLLFEEVDTATENFKLGISEENPEGTDGIEKDTTIKIVAVGDILCENFIYEDAYDADAGAYDFSHMFSEVKKHTSSSDVTLGLLETNFVESQNYSGQGKFNSPKEFAQELKNIGIDVLHTASNHSLDYGFEGVKSTLDYLEELEFDTVGTYRSQEEADETLIKDIEGIRIAFLSYTYGSNVDINQVAEKDFCINVIEKEKIKKDIEKAKDAEVDFVFVHMHWGGVNSSKQNESQKELADFLFENGADFVLGSHPASLQPMEVRTNEDGKNVFIAYSTGNFISASKYTNSNIEMILNIEVTKSGETGDTRLTKVTYVPIYLLDNGRNSETRYKLLDIKEEIKRYENGDTSYIVENTYKSLKEAINTIEKLIGKE